MIQRAYLLQRIAALVANNDHGEAIVLGAKALGLTELAERVENINRQQLRLGHLPPSLYLARETARAALMDHARKVMAPADFQRFNGAI